MSIRTTFSVRKQLTVGTKSSSITVFLTLKIKATEIYNLPFSIKVLLEAAVRQFDGRAITSEHVKQIAGWAERP